MRVIVSFYVYAASRKNGDVVDVSVLIAGCGPMWLVVDANA